MQGNVIIFSNNYYQKLLNFLVYLLQKWLLGFAFYYWILLKFYYNIGR